MGQIPGWKLILLIVLLALTGLCVHGRYLPPTIALKRDLRSAVSNIPGWETGAFVPIDPEVVRVLDMDDYVNQSYWNSTKRITLFIGYYGTAKKVGSAHSPLVCFPGQGWSVLGTKEKAVRVPQGTVHLSCMVVEKGERRVLVLYWFQAYDMTSAGTLLQKLYLVFARVTKNREENAFVRISITMDGQPAEEGFHAGELFIRSFYPEFLTFMREQGS